MTSINSAEALQTSNATSLKSNINKTLQAGATASSFAQQLTTASSNLNTSGVSSAANNIINAGLNSNELLSQSLKNGVQSQFTNLGNDIASSLIASFSGQNSTISTDTETASDTVTDADSKDSVDATQKTADSAEKTDTKDAVGDESITAVSESETTETADAAQIAEAKETESSSSIFPEFIQNLFADLAIFKTQNTTELTDVDSEESDTEQVSETNEEINSTTEEQVAS